ncbi:MAG: PCMD domain-containing protein [Chitinophagales bacterium]|nr:PCMD domain-containing protein [Chitinophagales bacterium]
MKKFLLAVFLANVCATLNYAQDTLINQRMESWENLGQDTEEPIQWNSNKTGGGNAPSGPNTLRRDTSTLLGGQYCARIRSGTTLGIVVNGSLTTGRVEAPSFNKAEGYIRSIPGNPPFRMPFTGRPDSFVFWVRYAPQGSDYARVEARLHVGHAYAPEAPVNNNHPDSTQNIIARALWNNQTATNKNIPNWTRISVPFSYVDNRIPQFILVTATSSGDQAGGTANSTLWLDEFRVIYNPTLSLTGNKNYGTVYVSALSGASLNISYTASGSYNSGNNFTAQLSDINGSFANPQAIGSIASITSGTISASIPAGTATGNNYRIRVVSSNPALVSDTGVLSVVLVTNNISPSGAQTIAAGKNGTTLSVTETPGAVSREWKFSTLQGGPYQSFSPAQNATSFTPNFPNAGIYYIVCETSYPGGTIVRSNEVTITVVSNQITPASPQSLLINTPGTTLTVTESAPASSREWKYTTTSGSNYISFNPIQTGLSYTPQFANPGIYYVVCQSNISGVVVTSNEVTISVNSVTLATSSVNGFPLYFSPNAPAGNVSVSYTTGGGSFNAGNIFTAQLSDANGNFANPLNIGSISSTASGTISAVVPNNTPAGTGYRIRVVSSNPPIIGTDNGNDLTIDQFSNRINPSTKQVIRYATNGSPLTVSESQQTISRRWKYGNTPSGPFVPFSPTQSSQSYVPNFSIPGTYFVVCSSLNQYGDSVTSNAVEIEVTNGTQLFVTSYSGAPYLISPKANVSATVNFSSDILFGANNNFTLELSDENGNFSNPVALGSVSATSLVPITVNIPNSLLKGNGYRFRVLSSNPPVTGTPGAPFSVIPFEVSVSPKDTQNAIVNIPATTLTITETHPIQSREWLVSYISGSFYNSFSPKETGSTISPVFLGPGTAYVVCRSVNTYNDTLQSAEVVFLVQDNLSTINNLTYKSNRAWFDGNNLIVFSEMETGRINLFNTAGMQVASFHANKGLNAFDVSNLPVGIYFIQQQTQNKIERFKILKEN